MNRPWSAEQDVSALLARALIESQFPELAPASVESLGIGWDNTAFQINGQYVFRFPRRQIAVDLIETEARVLPAIAARLPLAIPVPTFIGRPDERFPWPFSGYRMIAGRTACRAALDEEQRVAAAESIAQFLAALHEIHADEARELGAGPDTIGRLDLVKRVPQTRDYLEQIVRLDLFDGVDQLKTGIDKLVGAFMGNGELPDQNLSLVHGDLYYRHLLVNDAKQPCGVIDWGDVHYGDPAVDLAFLCSYLPPAALDVFRSAYGPISEDTWRRAKFRALNNAAIVLVYGNDIGDANLVRESQLALRHALVN